MQVAVEKLKAGAVILSDIKDDTGKVVVKPGIKITPLLLKRLVTWGVKSVDVEVEEIIPVKSAEESKPQDKKVLANIDKELVLKIARKFSKVREDELMDKLMRLAIKHLSNKQANK